MARRSARLNKACKSNEAGSTFLSNTSPSSNYLCSESLPTVKGNLITKDGTTVPSKNNDKQCTPSKIPSLATKKTPDDKTPARLPNKELHPHHHHVSTAKPMDEARWLGFLAKGAHTEPVASRNKLAVIHRTPTKTPTTTKNPFTTPEFKFRYKQPSLELSPAAKKMMEDSREEASKIRAQMVADSAQSAGHGRKIAQPKGKAGRFSDVHMAEFKKMDSITTHHSIARIDPSKLKPCVTSLKRKQSRVELDDMNEAPKYSRFTIKPVDDGTKNKVDVSTKRMKHNAGEDTSSARPKLQEGIQHAPRTPSRFDIVKSGTSRFASRLLTPTKASVARTQSAKSLRTKMLPYAIKSPAVKSVAESKAKIEQTLKEQIRKTSDSLAAKMPGLKSILRSPQRLYSNDPFKIAAGTHITTPPSKIGHIDLPVAPATAPLVKHVAFSASTVERFEHDSAPSPSPETEMSTPDNQPLTYPKLPGDIVASPSTPQKLVDNTPGNFTFRSDMSITFSPGPRQTIRKVRPSNASEFVREPEKKRKLNDFDETEGFDKENVADDHCTDRPVKKIKPSEQEVKTITKVNISRKSRVANGLSRSRLNLLALPKRRKT